MSKRSKSKPETEMRPEYDFSKGTRGKHYRNYRRGHDVKVHRNDGTVVVRHFQLEDGAVMLAPDVRQHFSDSDSVNQALRALIELSRNHVQRPTH